MPPPASWNHCSKDRDNKIPGSVSCQVGQNSSSEPPSTLSDAIPIGLRAGGSLVFSPAPEIDSAVTGSSELVAFSPDVNQTDSERLLGELQLSQS